MHNMFILGPQSSILRRKIINILIHEQHIPEKNQPDNGNKKYKLK